MFAKILNTFFTRIIATLLMFVVVIINTNTFGAEGTGIIALVILGLTILQVLTNFVGGTALVYLTPRHRVFQLLFLSYVWAGIANVGGLIVLYVFQLIPPDYVWHLLALTSIYSVYYIHSAIMQGKEDIKIFNGCQLLQAVLLVLTLTLSLLVCKRSAVAPRIDLYLYAFIFSYFVPALLSCFYIGKHIDKPNFRGILVLLKEMFQLGFWTQLANLTQLLTYRLNYYLVKGFIGSKPLGIYDLGTKISEAVWIFPKSICLVQYARISNTQDDQYATTLTLGLLKIVFLFALTAIVVLYLLPSSFIAWIFGPDFINSKPVIDSLLPGILFLSCMTILSHHFAGYGKYWINAVGSVIGLAVTAVLGFTLIPTAMQQSSLLALRTAGWISSTAYLCSFLFTLVCFCRFTKVRFHDFLIAKKDCKMMKEVIKENVVSLRSRVK